MCTATLGSMPGDSTWTPTSTSETSTMLCAGTMFSSTTGGSTSTPTSVWKQVVVHDAFCELFPISPPAPVRPGLVKSALALDWRALQFAIAELQADRAITMFAVAQQGHLLQCAWRR